MERDYRKEIFDYVSKHPGYTAPEILKAIDAVASQDAIVEISQLQRDGCIRFDKLAYGFVVTD